MRRSLNVLSVAGLVAMVIASAGCQPEVDPALMLLDTKVSETRVDDLKRSMDFVRSKRQFDIKEFEDRVNSSLNRWANNNMDSKVDWTLDPMVEDLVAAADGFAFTKRINEVSFVNSDAAFLQSCAWSKLLADRMAGMQTLDGFELYRMAAEYQPQEDSEADPLAEIMAKLHSGMNEADSNKLSDAVRIFDWITRNIQLLPHTKLTAEEIEEARLYKSDRDSQSGVPGLGYVRFPAQVLVYGRGDYAERAKVFINVVTQTGLTAVMLHVDQEGEDGSKKSVPWCVGVDIGDQLYLFDTRLGMPVPNHKTNGIATLADVKADPELLNWFDLSLEESLAKDTKYWVKPDQIGSVKANVLVSPESISVRMATLEGNFRGEDEPTLTVVPTAIANRVKELDSEMEVGIWEVAFDTHYYRNALRQALNDAAHNNRLADKVAWYYTDEAYIDGFAVYRTARSVFLHGQFHSARGEMRGNAIQRFFALMYTDDAIRNLSTTPKLQRRHGILKDQGQSAIEYQQALTSVQGQMRLIARDTSYFLAQCHFDNGNLGVASLWLDRIKNKGNAERWKDGIFYLLARSLEGNREYDRALETYRQDKDSAQLHGNLIRARMLAGMIPEMESTETATN